MDFNYRNAKNSVKMTFDDLKMFEQTKYCYDFLKKEFPNETDDEIKRHSQIASSCFRQANEYYVSASNSSISINPLLYSYALNNLLKGVCYLKTFDPKILKLFKAHGFKVDEAFLKDDILKSKTTIMKQKGAVHALLELYNNSLNNQNIDFYKILRHIPGIENYYYRTVGSISFIGEKSSNNKGHYFCGISFDVETKNIFRKMHIVGNVLKKEKMILAELTLATMSLFENGTIDRGNVYYKNHINIPEEYEEGLKDINIAFYCYLLIMSYGMMVRYNADIWEKYIDKKTSLSSVLVELSIPAAITNFYFQIHYLLYGFYYVEERVVETDIKRIINESTDVIMDNIRSKIERKNDIYGLNKNNL